MRFSLLLHYSVRSLAAALLVGSLSGCGLFGLTEDWFGEAEGPPLPGERVAVLTISEALQADPRLVDTPVKLPRPRVNPNWEQSGGRVDNANQHLAAGEVLKEAWVASIGTGSSSERRMMAAPIVVDGKVFAMDVNANLSAFEAASGKLLWRTKLAPKDENDGFGGGIAYYEGKIYAATGFAEVVAVKVADGAIVWRTALPGPMRAAPAILAGRVFAITIDNQTHALDSETGEKLWFHAGLAEVASLLGAASPAGQAGNVVAAYSSGELVALRVENGRALWADNLSNVRRIDALSSIADIRGKPVIDRGVVYAISHSGRMVAIDLRSGGRIWERPIAGVETPWVAGDFIYVLTVDSQILCLTRDSGRVRWVTQLPHFVNEEKNKYPIIWTGPVLVSDRLVVGGSHGLAMTISPYTGELLGMQPMPAGVSIPPIVAGETLYFLSDNARLVALR